MEYRLLWLVCIHNPYSLGEEVSSSLSVLASKEQKRFPEGSLWKTLWLGWWITSKAWKPFPKESSQASKVSLVASSSYFLHDEPLLFIFPWKRHLNASASCLPHDPKMTLCWREWLQLNWVQYSVLFIYVAVGIGIRFSQTAVYRRPGLSALRRALTVSVQSIYCLLSHLCVCSAYQQ